MKTFKFKKIKNRNIILFLSDISDISKLLAYVVSISWDAILNKWLTELLFESWLEVEFPFWGVDRVFNISCASDDAKLCRRNIGEENDK